jgi:hypothetical protein
MTGLDPSLCLLSPPARSESPPTKCFRALLDFGGKPREHGLTVRHLFQFHIHALTMNHDEKVETDT